MRISDWSSDVCSSDLDGRAKIGSHAMLLVLAALLTVSAIPVLAQDIPTEAPGAPDPSRVVAGTYNVDSDHTQARFTVTHLGFSTYTGMFVAPTEIGRAHVCTPVTNAQLVCRPLLDKKTSNKFLNTIS